MVLHLGQQNRVTFAQILQSPSLGHQIQAFGGASGENDFFPAVGVKVFGDALTGALVGFGSAVAEFVDAAVDVGVVALVVGADGVDDDLRFLATGGVVEIYEGMTVNGLLEDGEIVTELGPVDRCLSCLRALTHHIMPN